MCICGAAAQNVSRRRQEEGQKVLMQTQPHMAWQQSMTCKDALRALTVGNPSTQVDAGMNWPADLHTCTRASMSSTLTCSTAFMRRTSMHTPPCSALICPSTLVPAPKGMMGTPCLCGQEVKLHRWTSLKGANESYIITLLQHLVLQFETSSLFLTTSIDDMVGHPSSPASLGTTFSQQNFPPPPWGGL